jgi:PAS domain S-box-containing protein
MSSSTEYLTSHQGTAFDKTAFEQLADTEGAFIVITDPKGTIIYANKTTSEITGYTPDEIRGKTPALWGGQMSKQFYNNFWHVLTTEKKPLTAEVINKKKNGERFPAELNVTPIIDDKDDICYFVNIGTLIEPPADSS